MKCIDCKWFSGTVNDTYGLCKRYPTAQNKTHHDWCGDYVSKVKEELVSKLEIKFVEPTEYEVATSEPTEYNITTDEFKPKRGRKPKNVD